MIHLITQENRALYRRDLLEMHRQRKALFVDQMHWPLACEEGLEIDQFDAPDSIYLLHFASSGELLASARLLPTSRPHLLDTVFPQLCAAGVPKGADIWEATRFCPLPTLESEARHQLLGVIISGILEAGLIFGMRAVTFVAGAALKPLALQAGWRAEALGPTLRYKRDRVSACIAALDPEGLARVRQRFGLSGPVLRYGPVRQAA